MEKESSYLHFLIRDLEIFMEDNFQKVENLVKGRPFLSEEEGRFILDKYYVGLKKVMEIIRASEDIDDKHTLKLISIVSSEVLAWVAFTFPIVESSLPFLSGDLYMRGRHIVDTMFDVLVELNEAIENPRYAQTMRKDIFSMYNDISMFFGHLSHIVQKGAMDN